jgi:hypothetical protein
MSEKERRKKGKERSSLGESILVETEAMGLRDEEEIEHVH